MHIQRVQLFLLSLLIFTFPYNMPSFVLSTLSIILFILTFFRRDIRLGSIFQERELLLLFGFILFTYLSILWTTGEGYFDGDFKTNFGRFKYYFLLIPAIYYAKFTIRQLRFLLYMVIISPVFIVLTYYLNIMGITDIYSFHSGGHNPYFGHYLVTNTFILFSSLALYIGLFESLKKRALKASLLYVAGFVFVAASLFIDERNEARLVNLAFLILLISTPMFYISNRLRVLVLLAAMTLIPLYLINSDKLATGYERFTQAVEEDRYEGSWGHRTGYIIVGWTIFLENPILGRGIDDISSQIEKIKSEEPKYFRGEDLTRLHNGHLNFLVQIGIVGYLFLLYLFYSVAKIRIKDHAVHTFKSIVLLLLLVLMMGEHYLSIRHTTNLFAVLIAIWIVYRKLEQSAAIEEPVPSKSVTPS